MKKVRAHYLSMERHSALCATKHQEFTQQAHGEMLSLAVLDKTVRLQTEQ
jgi:hypothetical protein